MPTVTLNKKVFESLVGKKIELDKLKDRISMLGTDLESIEGNEIHVEVFPNRPDMLSEQGFARAFSSFIGVKTGLREYQIKKSGIKVFVDKNVKDVRPFTVCAVVRDICFDDEKIKEVIQVQEKLHTTFCRNRKKAAIGIYPLEHIKPPIYFKAMKPADIRFRPLESDRVMTGVEILSRHPKGRDFAHLLEGKGMFAVFVDSAEEIMSLTPIINSHLTGKVTEKTKDVFIEFSGFSLEYQLIGLNMLAALFADMGGKVESVDVVYPDKTVTTPDLTPKKMKIDVGYVNKVLSLDLKDKDVKVLLERMGFGFDKGVVLVPAYRADILHPIDLVEDVAIAYGYENFKDEIPEVSTIGAESDIEIFKRRIAGILIGLGLIEVNSYHLTNEECHDKRMDHKTKMVRLANALTADYDSLRNWLIPSLCKVLSENTRYEYPQNIFEMARVFVEDKDSETLVDEPQHLAVLLCGPDVDFTSARKALDALMAALDLEYDVSDGEHSSFVPGRVADVSIKGKKVAFVGEISPKVISNWGLEMPIVGFEFDLSLALACMKR